MWCLVVDKQKHLICGLELHLMHSNAINTHKSIEKNANKFQHLSLPSNSSSSTTRQYLAEPGQLLSMQQIGQSSNNNHNIYTNQKSLTIHQPLDESCETKSGDIHATDGLITRIDLDCNLINNNTSDVAAAQNDSDGRPNEAEGASGGSIDYANESTHMQQRRWSQYPSPILTLTAQEQCSRLADKENAIDDSIQSPSSNSDKKSLWNFSSKFSPRRSADISNLEKFNFRKMQQQNSADYVNLPFDFNQSLSLQNGNQSPNHNNISNTTKTFATPLHQPPEIVSRSQDCMVQTGTTAVLSCRIRNYENGKITWRKTEPNPSPISQSTKFNYNLTNAGEARLMITHTTMADSGLYVCAVSNRYGMTQCTIGLTVLSSQLDVLTESNIEVVGPTSARINWESLNSYYIEHCQIGTMKWLRTDEKPAKSKHILTGLSPGESYTLRLVCPNSGVASLPSPPIIMPLSDTHMWQQQQFSNRYTILSELGRGRFAVIRLASDLVTGQRVALKQVYRRHQDLGTTQEEYKLLASAQHPNIVRGLALFENAPTPGSDTIVMELVQGLHLFNFVCQKESYSEYVVQTYMRQLISALSWLHSRNIAHLDLKPENVMVHLSSQHHHQLNQTSQATLKLIDFGESVRCKNRDIVLPPSNLEFAAPEMVMGQPLTQYTDSWCFGILLYVFLSGVSPFLDDSIEETTANILKCDFSFPDDYFHDISNDAKNLLTRLLVLQASNRATMAECQQLSWFIQEPQRKVIPKTKLEYFNERRMRNSVTMLQQISFKNL